MAQQSERNPITITATSPQQSPQKLASFSTDFATPCRPDFDLWASAVKQQMLSVLEKRR